jgi:hypothetical protein
MHRQIRERPNDNAGNHHCDGSPALRKARVRWEEIKFNEITDVTLNSEKMQATGVIISLSNGETREIPVVGRQGRFLDVFEFLRFLRRVVDDLRGFQLGRSG